MIPVYYENSSKNTNTLEKSEMISPREWASWRKMIRKYSALSIRDSLTDMECSFKRIIARLPNSKMGSEMVNAGHTTTERSLLRDVQDMPSWTREVLSWWWKDIWRWDFLIFDERRNHAISWWDNKLRKFWLLIGLGK